MRKIIFAALLPLLLASCASKQAIGPNGYSPAYAEGYSDGCASVKRKDLINDDDRYGSEQQYTLGWSDGFRSCESPEEMAQRQQRVNVLQNGVAQAQNDYFLGFPSSGQPSKKVSSTRLW